MCVSIVSVRHASKPLLAGRVPDLQLDRRVVDGDNFVLQEYTGNIIFYRITRYRGSRKKIIDRKFISSFNASNAFSRLKNKQVVTNISLVRALYLLNILQDEMTSLTLKSMPTVVM